MEIESETGVTVNNDTRGPEYFILINVIGLVINIYEVGAESLQDDASMTIGIFSITWPL